MNAILQLAPQVPLHLDLSVEEPNQVKQRMWGTGWVAQVNDREGYEGTFKRRTLVLVT